MPENNWLLVKEVFHEALKRSPEERDRYLDQACAGDIDLRIDVESLLISLANAESFLEQPLVSESSVDRNLWRLKNGQIFSHYTVISPIASGGMGEVYLAEDNKLHRKVALKILRQEVSADRDRLRRFKREAEVVSALNHPNILTIFEFDVIDDIHFFVSEFVKGETLRLRLDGGPLPLTEALDVVIQVGYALKAAHEAGVVHRDIKPENIMIREDGYVKVLDFGLAKLTESSSTPSEGPNRVEFSSLPGVILGTAAYMSPEQTRGLSIDSRTDTFSLGVVLYEVLTGHSPFKTESQADTVAAIVQKDPKPPSRLADNIPRELDRIVAKMVEKNRSQRYQTALDLLIDLKYLRRQFDVAPIDGNDDRIRNLGQDPAEQIGRKDPASVLAPPIPQYAIALGLATLVLGAVALAYWYFSG